MKRIVITEEGMYFSHKDNDTKSYLMTALRGHFKMTRGEYEITITKSKKGHYHMQQCPDRTEHMLLYHDDEEVGIKSWASGWLCKCYITEIFGKVEMNVKFNIKIKMMPVQ